MKTNFIQNTFRIILGLFMTFAGVAHLTFLRQKFVDLVPKWLPNDPQFVDFMVVSSGVVEIILGISLIFLIKHRIKLGITLALFLLLVYLGNISQYVNKINAFSLDTDQKRFIRLLFQPILVLWALWSTGALKYLFNSKKD